MFTLSVDVRVGVASNRRGHIFLPRAKGDAYLGLKWAGCYASSGCAYVPLNIPCMFLVQISTIAPWLWYTSEQQHSLTPSKRPGRNPERKRNTGIVILCLHLESTNVTHFLLNKWHEQLESAAAMWVVNKSFKLSSGHDAGHLPQVYQMKRNRDQTVHIIWLLFVVLSSDQKKRD